MKRNVRAVVEEYFIHNSGRKVRDIRSTAVHSLRSIKRHEYKHLWGPSRDELGLDVGDVSPAYHVHTNIFWLDHNNALSHLAFKSVMDKIGARHKRQGGKFAVENKSEIIPNLIATILTYVRPFDLLCFYKVNWSWIIVTDGKFPKMLWDRQVYRCRDGTREVRSCIWGPR